MSWLKPPRHLYFWWCSLCCAPCFTKRSCWNVVASDGVDSIKELLAAFCFPFVVALAFGFEGLGWTSPSPSCNRKLYGQQKVRGNRTESLWEGNLPLRGSLRGPLKTSEKSLKTTEDLWKPLKTSENLWKPSFSEILAEADFPLRGSRSCCPYSFAP